MASVAIPATVVGPGRPSQMVARVQYINGLSSFGGLKAHNSVVSLGVAVSTEESFANIVNSLKKPSHGGGAMTSTCNAVAEIIRIAAIMPGLVLVGFVLLRLEASSEE